MPSNLVVPLPSLSCKKSTKAPATYLPTASIEARGIFPDELDIRPVLEAVTSILPAFQQQSTSARKAWKPAQGPKTSSPLLSECNPPYLADSVWKLLHGHLSGLRGINTFWFGIRAAAFKRIGYQMVDNSVNVATTS
ncbi:hypothetical protein C2857_000771 [Epichloe festucae Fl1]|uniref:Uncharacterized protein n=1 Tax=Epichloe festucae (strain Fl1) TaxID=877507 RepID=A0A7U3Q188_EPIFF|nr:hypothetical protein C2857_000771 [Epichloe festucae Fl1]